MKKLSFLDKLKNENKLKLVEPSEEMCSSYLEKSDNCLKSARLLFQNNLYENSISLAYYTMYNSLSALFFKIGIKCENHAGSILLFKKLFARIDLFKIISFAKEERIDKQYYITSKTNFVLTKESALEMIKKAEDFLIQIKLIIKNIRNEEIENLRKKFKHIK
jgi:uncharacterized protein (UPF0332 family)